MLNAHLVLSWKSDQIFPSIISLRLSVDWARFGATSTKQFQNFSLQSRWSIYGPYGRQMASIQLCHFPKFWMWKSTFLSLFIVPWMQVCLKFWESISREIQFWIYELASTKFRFIEMEWSAVWELEKELTEIWKH